MAIITTGRPEQSTTELIHPIAITTPKKTATPPRTGTGDDVFQQSDLHQTGMYPTDQQKSREERNNDCVAKRRCHTNYLFSVTAGRICRICREYKQDKDSRLSLCNISLCSSRLPNVDSFGDITNHTADAAEPIVVGAERSPTVIVHEAGDSPCKAAVRIIRIAQNRRIVQPG